MPEGTPEIDPCVPGVADGKLASRPTSSRAHAPSGDRYSAYHVQQAIEEITKGAAARSQY
jgi:hypothetical protein